MINISKWIHELSNDILLDQRGSGLQIIDRKENGNILLDIPFEKRKDFEDMLRKSGVTFESRWMHTIVIQDYPENLKLKEI